MPPQLLRALLALVPTSLLFTASIISLFRAKSFSGLLQVAGAGCLFAVVLTHFAEAVHMFSSLGWGQEHSAGHYLNLCSAALGLTLFPLGYLLQALTRTRA